MSEPTNADRAAQALVGVDAFAEHTRYNVREQSASFTPGDEDGKANAEEIISDLLCNMHHLCDVFGISFDGVLRRAQSDYGHDVSEERNAAIEELLTPDPWGQAGGQ